MSSELTKYLLVVFVLLALTGGLWLLQTYKDPVEHFRVSDDAIRKQNEFVQTNMDEAKIGNGVMDVTHMPNADDLKRATEDIDLFAQRERPPTEKWFSNTANSKIHEMERRCRAIQRPEDLPDDNRKQRIDCTWMFSETGKGGATLCSLAGPILATARADYPTNEFQMIWSKNEAIKKERIKQCAQITRCELIVPGRGCGFCPELGRGIPANQDGSSMYPEARCMFNAVMTREDCFKPRSEGGGGVNRSACEPDNQGRLSKACLSALAQQASCNDRGTILQALQDPTSSLSSPRVMEATEALRAYNFTIPEQILRDGNITADTALNTYINIANASRSGANNRIRRAAGNLCFGADFQVCDYDDDSRENFRLDCLQKLYTDVGCQGRGSDFPTEQNRNRFAGTNWGTIKAQVNRLAETMTNRNRQFTAEQQRDAIRRCIGVQMRRRNITFCNELGISVKMYYGPNNAYFGRRILTNQFFTLRNDSTFWDSLDVFSSEISRWQNVRLVIETNINPENNQLLNFNRFTNTRDEVRWNDEVVASKQHSGFGQNPVNGLTVAKDQQGNQRFKITVDVDGNQVHNRAASWYLADSANNTVSINVCRLPNERKNPVINIVMNQGNVVETTGTVQIEPRNLTTGTRGGRSCTIFNGHSGHIQIMTHMRTRAFRSYTCRIFLERYGNHPRIWQFYNGSQDGRWEWSWNFWDQSWWRWGRHGGGFWQWRTWTNNESWGHSQANVQMALGNNNSDIIPCFKEHPHHNHSIIAWQPGMPLNQWVHITWVWNDDYTGFTLFLNGRQFASATGPAIRDEVTTQNFIGKAFWDGWHGLITGGMEWFRAFDYPLTADEIAQDMDDDW